MPGKNVNDLGRRIGDRHEPVAQFGQRVAVGVLHQAADDVVEQCNLIAAVEFGAAEEQIDDLAQGRAAPEIRRLASVISSSARSDCAVSAISIRVGWNSR